MKRNLVRTIILFSVAFLFMFSNFAISFEGAGIKISGKKTVAYASPRGFGGFKSGGFKARSSSSGFKSGLFKSGSSKSTSKSTGILGGIFGSRNTYTTKTHRSIIPIFIPWGGFHGGFGVFSFMKLIFDLIIIVIIIAVILWFFRRRR